MKFLSKPPTEKVHQIISRTAKFVSEHGGQSEIILRVKQGDNPTFGFLMPDHELHAYFRFLVGHPELAQGVTDSADRQVGMKKSSSGDNELHVAGGALSLLGSVYGSGEDDGGVQDTLELQEKRVENAEDGTSASLPFRSQVPSSSLGEETKIVMKPPTAAREKPSPARKNRSSITVTASSAQSKIKDVSGGSVNFLINMPEGNASDHGALILEPPSSLKRMVDKTVDFILRNGKEFEASLIEQDKTNEKFPFLRPSSQYHPYYLKVLQDARESKLPRKNLSDQRNLPVGRVRNTTRGTVSDESLSDERKMMHQFEGSYQLDRKEKFRMVIGGAKKDTNNSIPKPAKPPGLSAEEAAAIVMAATRGLSKPAMSDAAPKTSVDNSHTFPKVTGGHRSSSLGSFPPLSGYNPVSKTNSDGKAGSSLPDGFSLGTGKASKESCNTAGGVLVANVVAKTVAGEADSSDAYLTKEQKVRAERLKRARMFAAMIKSEKHEVSELIPATIAQSGSQVAAASSVLSGREFDLAWGREGSSVPVDAEISDSEEKSCEKVSKNESRRERSHEKDASMSGHHTEDTEERKHLRKRHRSRHSSHSSRDGHKHKHRSSHRDKHPDSSQDEHSHSNKDKHKRKHHSSSKHKGHGSDEDERLNRKRSEVRHCRERHKFSDDEGRVRKGSHSHHKKSRMEEIQNLENDGDSSASNLSKQVSLNLSNDIQKVAHPLASQGQSSDATDVPDDLRAKIRAMLLETV
uniref:Splicing factor, suppressor of white-apricot n=1 Tax=Anthurium amnicola TaxID=1678845 RepID=A0A1D1ZGC9_9ARAE